MKTALLTLLLCAATLLGAPAENTAKLRVTNPQRAQQLVARGAKIIADYGSFQMLEAPAALATETAGQSDVTSADDMNVIHLNAARLNTTTAPVKALRTTRAAFTGKRLHLVQFAGPVKPEWRDELEQRGARIVTHIPNNAYLIYADHATLAKIQAWAGTAAHVQWDGAFADEHKLHPRAKNTDANGQPRDIGTDTFAIQLVEDDEVNAATLAVIGQHQLAPVQNDYKLLGYRTVIVQLPAASLAAIAAQPDVVSIHPYFKHRKFDERQGQIMAGNLTGNVPTGPGYLAWLGGKGFTQSQFDTSGFIVDVTDSGIDNGTTAPGHFALYKQGNPAGTSRVAYNRLEGTANAGSTLAGCDGHGNLNSHIIGGYSAMPVSATHNDASGFQYGLGVCPFVKVGSSVIFDPDTFTNPNYPNLQSRAYNNGARVSGNSWGADTAGDYDADAQAYDALVRDAQPTGSTFATAGNQPMVIVFAAGNAGVDQFGAIVPQSVGSPGTAKNVIVAGAAENVRAFGGADGSGVADTGANSANDIIDFSSRGPCADGRFKPDLAAPGTHVTGGLPQSGSPTTNGTGAKLSCFNGGGVSGGVGGMSNFPPGQLFYTASSGTSHSTPGIAGACALLRQFFINASLTPPSPAMTKAFLVNSARYMTGTYANDTLPSQAQGMGHVNLGTAFDGVARVLRDQTSADKFTATGQTRTFTGNVTDNAKPFRVTLAWTDAPGSTTGNAYNNNLDLTVTVGGNTYKGNIFSGANSATGGTADAKNNVESVFIPAGVSGAFTVTVTAANINSDGVPNEAPTLDQDFALVIYNADTSAPNINTPPQSQTVVVGSPADFFVDASGQAPLSYQWFFNNSPLGGAPGTNYSIASTTTNDAGGYFVIVTNSFGSATSSVATLTVATAPIILTNPVSLNVVTGATANFSAFAIGLAPLAYQWQFNGADLAAATNTTYSKANVQTNDAGFYTVIITNSAGTVTSPPALLVVSTGSATNVVISQIYGGGGNAVTSSYTNDYVELFNAGGSAVNVTGWTVQYASASGTSWSTAVTLSGTIPPGGYYLVKLAGGGSASPALPTPDASGGINISGSSGKVALVNSSTLLSGSNPVGASSIVDFVGYGTANAFEGGGAAPGGGNTTAVLRNGNGTVDTGNNNADFTAGTPNPRNSSGVVVTNPPDLSIRKSHAANFTQGDAADTYTIVVTNVGALASTGTVTVVDTLPGGLTATAISGTGWATNLGTLTCTRSDTLAANASYPAITITVSVATNAAANVTNSVTVSGGSETNTANNAAIDPTSITASGGGGGGTNTYSGVLVGWDMSGLTAFGSSPQAPTTNAPLLVVVAGLTRGAGVTTTPTAATRAWGGNGFDSSSSAAAITASDFATLAVAATNGYKLSFSNISRFDYRRSGSGATNGLLQFQIGSGAFTDITNVIYSSSANGGANLGAIDLSAIGALQNVGAGTNVTFRLVNYSGTGGNWYIYDQANTPALDFTIQGSIAPLTPPAPPAPPAVAPVISNPAIVGGQFQFNLTGTIGSNYVVLVSTNLADTNWLSIWTNPAPFTFVETNGTNFPLRFYRGRVQP